MAHLDERGNGVDSAPAAMCGSNDRGLGLFPLLFELRFDRLELGAQRGVLRLERERGSEVRVRLHEISCALLFEEQVEVALPVRRRAARGVGLGALLLLELRV